MPTSVIYTIITLNIIVELLLIGQYLVWLYALRTLDYKDNIVRGMFIFFLTKSLFHAVILYALLLTDVRRPDNQPPTVDDYLSISIFIFLFLTSVGNFLGNNYLARQLKSFWSHRGSLLSLKGMVERDSP